MGGWDGWTDGRTDGLLAVIVVVVWWVWFGLVWFGLVSWGFRGVRVWLDCVLDCCNHGLCFDVAAAIELGICWI